MSRPAVKTKTAGRTRQGLTPLQEAFALAYLETGVGSDAYRLAKPDTKGNDATIRREAAKMLAHPGVAARIRALQARAAMKAEITVDTLTDKLVAIHDAAMAEKSFTAAVRAVSELGKLHGLIIERRAVLAKHEHDITADAGSIPGLADFFVRALGGRPKGPDAGVVEGGPVLSSEVCPPSS